MTKAVIQPLESYRLAQYALPVPCYICGTENTFDAEFCSHCAAPMALAHQASSQKVQPRLIAVIGASGAGKTVYLGMLMDMLSRQSEHMQLLARGAFSINLQQATVAALARCRFPDKTPNEPDRWNWVHCQIRRPNRKQVSELIVPDMAGEAVLQEVDHPHTFRVIGSFLKKCLGAMILVDATRVVDHTRSQDYFTMKLLSYLSELDEQDGKHPWHSKPVAVVFTKADQCPACLSDPEAYAREHAAGLYQQCQERFARHKFFAASVAGACAWRDSLTQGRTLVPLRIEPHGVVEPFEWLFDHLKG